MAAGREQILLGAEQNSKLIVSTYFLHKLPKDNICCLLLLCSTISYLINANNIFETQLLVSILMGFIKFIWISNNFVRLVCISINKNISMYVWVMKLKRGTRCNGGFYSEVSDKSLSIVKQKKHLRFFF